MSHIPDKGQVRQRYYGWYASRGRGRRRRANDGDTPPLLVAVEPSPEALRHAQRRWAEVLRRIFEVEPWAGPRGGQELRIVAFLTAPPVIDRILEALRRSAPKPHRPRAPPSRRPSPDGRATQAGAGGRIPVA